MDVYALRISLQTWIIETVNATQKGKHSHRRARQNKCDNVKLLLDVLPSLAADLPSLETRLGNQRLTTLNHEVQTQIHAVNNTDNRIALPKQAKKHTAQALYSQTPYDPSRLPTRVAVTMSTPQNSIPSNAHTKNKRTHATWGDAAHETPSNSTVSAPTSAALDSVECPPKPVLEQERHIADAVAVGQQIPASRAIPVVVQPGAEDQVCRRTEEEPEITDRVRKGLEDHRGCQMLPSITSTHKIIIHVKNPQPLLGGAPASSLPPPPGLSGSDGSVDWLAHAYFVFQVRLRTSTSASLLEDP